MERSAEAGQLRHLALSGKAAEEMTWREEGKVREAWGEGHGETGNLDTGLARLS